MSFSKITEDSLGSQKKTKKTKKKTNTIVASPLQGCSVKQNDLMLPRNLQLAGGGGKMTVGPLDDTGRVGKISWRK